MHRGILPQQDVVLKEDGDGAQFDVERRNQFALHVVGYASESLIPRVRGKQNGNWHKVLSGSGESNREMIIGSADGVDCRS